MPGVGPAALYVPWRAQEGHDLPVVYVLCKRTASSFARASGLAPTGDQLVWDGTTPPFVVVVAHARQPARLERLVDWTQGVLPVSADRAGRAFVGVGSDAGSAVRIATGDPDLVGLTESLVRGSATLGLGSSLRAVHVRFHAARSLAGDLVYALQSPRARRREPCRAHRRPGRFRPSAHGARRRDDLAGPNSRQLRFLRLTRWSLVYLPPDVDPHRRYPLVVLLHGLRGSPYSFAGGLRFAAAIDPLIAARRLAPFIAVMPPAGLTLDFDGEWTGAWERYVVDDVVPWAGAHLPVRGRGRRAGDRRVLGGRIRRGRHRAPPPGAVRSRRVLERLLRRAA